MTTVKILLALNVISLIAGMVLEDTTLLIISQVYIVGALIIFERDKDANA